MKDEEGEGSVPVALGVVAEGVVEEDEGGHGFDHGDGAGEDARVVAAAAAEGGVLEVLVHGVLLVHDGGDGFEGDAEVDGFAVGDAALDAAGAVAGGEDAAVFGADGVVVLEAGEADAIKAGADVEALGGGEAEHGFGEVGLEAVEDGFAPADGDFAGEAVDDAADAVAGGTGFLDAGDHAGGGFGVGAANGVGLDLGEGDVFEVDLGGDVLDLGDAGEDFDAEALAEDFFGDGTSGNAADGFAGAGAAAALPVAESVFGLVGVVGVGGAELGGHLGIGFGAHVLVFHPHGDGGAKGFAFEGAGEDLDGVGFLAGGDDAGLAGAASVEVGLDVGFGEFDAGRASVNYDAYATAVGFAPSGDAEEMSEGVAHGKRVGLGGGRSKLKVQSSKLKERALRVRGWVMAFLAGR